MREQLRNSLQKVNGGTTQNEMRGEGWQNILVITGTKGQVCLSQAPQRMGRESPGNWKSWLEGRGP